MDTDSIIGSPWPTAEGLWVVWFPFISSSPSASSVAASFRSVEVETNKAATGSIRAKWVIEQQETDSGEIISGVLDAAERSGPAKCDHEQLGKTQVCQKSSSGRMRVNMYRWKRESERCHCFTFREETGLRRLFLCVAFAFLKLLWRENTEKYQHQQLQEYD